jgi:hypothetical protein
MICYCQERNMTDNLVAAMKPEIRFLNKPLSEKNISDDREQGRQKKKERKREKDIYIYECIYKNI